MINNKSFNRVIAESLFNLANNNATQLGDTNQEADMFSVTFDTADSQTPESQSFIGDGNTVEFTLNGTPARSDLIDVYPKKIEDFSKSIIPLYEEYQKVKGFFSGGAVGKEFASTLLIIAAIYLVI